MRFLHISHKIYLLIFQSDHVFSIQVDKTIDWTLELHLIICIIYLNKIREIRVLVKYVELMPFVRGTKECMFTTTYGVLHKMHLDFYKLVAITMDGVATMTENQQGLVAILRQSVCQLMEIYYIIY